MSSLKRPFYILCSIVLGVLLAVLVHSLVELGVIRALLATTDIRPYGLSWTQWFALHTAWTAFSAAVGSVGGYFLGIRWWQIVYVEKRHWRMRQAK